MTMSIISPVVVTDASLVSSTIAENDFLEWSPATAYAIGAKVIRAFTHRIYQRLVAGTTATAPELDFTNWLDIAPTNKWAMFDNVVGTTTKSAGNLTVVLRPGAVAGLALLELVGTQAAVTLKDAPGGATVYSKIITLDGTQINSFYEWFYTEFEQLVDVVLSDLPAHFISPELTIAITGNGSSACGVCKFGGVFDIGQTQMGATVGIVDYSRKTVDAFGNSLVAKRAFSKRADLKIFTEAVKFNQIFRVLADARSTPCIFIGTEIPGYAPLIIYGFYKDFSIDVAYPTTNLCNLSLEGLI